MNERIQQLADKAIEDMPGAWNIPDEFCKKFAELIVRECIDVGIKDFYNHLPNIFPANAIKKHFGVEQ
jgi:hypothetical protein